MNIILSCLILSRKTNQGFSMNHEKILILDFGSQYNQLIARRIREANVYCELRPFNISIEDIKLFNPKGIILSGGPESVYVDGAPRIDKEIFELGIPVLGICYGMQLMTVTLGGEVIRADKQEFGKAVVDIEGSYKEHNLFKNLPLEKGWQVWMSHGDSVKSIPENFISLGKTDNTPYAIIGNEEKNFYGVQFHPEVEHSEKGYIFLDNFVKKICTCQGDWTSESYIEETVCKIKKLVGDKNVILGFSGGVDSSVAALLLNKAIGDQLYCVFVDNGLLRLNERENVEKMFKEKVGLNLIIVDARERFLGNLKGITDPEAKRKSIGRDFVEVFQETVEELKHKGNFEFLAQGTIYPDVIESVSAKGGPSHTIKSHHNVGGLPEKMSLKVLEPLRDLFKDEVRRVGLELGLDKKMIDRHPFPGPGLGVRVLEEVTAEKCEVLKKADAIFLEEIEKAGIYNEIGQAFAVFLPIKAVGVMGDVRTYENVIALRAVRTIDFMTADWYRFEYDLLATVSNRIINEVRGVNRVVYDISSKPPGTIEWE